MPSWIRDPPGKSAAIASCMASADWKRCEGSMAMARWAMAATSGGTQGARSCSGCGAAEQMARRSWPMVWQCPWGVPAADGSRRGRHRATRCRTAVEVLQTPGLLGRHVEGRAHHRPGSREPAALGACGELVRPDLGDPEVEQLDDASRRRRGGPGTCSPTLMSRWTMPASCARCRPRQAWPRYAAPGPGGAARYVPSSWWTSSPHEILHDHERGARLRIDARVE